MRRPLIFAIWLLWLLIGIAFYFIGHKPADQQQLTALAAWLPGLILCGVLAVSAAALGYRFLPSWGTPERRLTFSGVLGLGIFSAAILLLGLLGIVRSEVAWLLVISGFVIGRRSLKPLGADFKTVFGNLRPRGWFAWGCAAYCSIVLLAALLQTLAPVTAWDGLAYHLNGPELYQTVGRITHPIDLPYLGFPQLGEMMFLHVQLLGSQTPSVLHWLFALLTTILVAGEAQRLWREPIGWAAAAIFLSAETVILEAGWPYIDLMLAFCVLAAYACLQAWRDDHTRRSLLLAAVFTGLAMASKYSAAPVAVALAVIVLRHGQGARVRSTLLFGLGAVLVALPWYLKSWVLLGNPVYPFAFNGLFWDPVRSELFNRFGTGLIYTAPVQLLTVPWDASIWGVEGKVGYAATIGPLFLLLMPIPFLGWRLFDRAQRTQLIDQLIIVGVVYGAWVYGMANSIALRQSRLLIPIFPVLSLIAAGAFQVLDHWNLPNMSLRRLASVLTTLVLIMTGLKVSLDVGRSDVIPVLTGRVSHEQYLTNSLGWYYEAIKAINQLGSDPTTLFLWEPRTLPCTNDCRPDAMLDKWAYARRTLGEPAAIAAAWRQSGIDYVLLWSAGYEAAKQLALNQFTAEDDRALQQLIRDQLELINDFGGVYQLYRLKASGG